MTFIQTPDKSGWDAKQITDHDALVALADIALCWATELCPDAQEQILEVLKDQPSAAMDWEDIAKLALGQDEYAKEHDETHEAVLDPAWEIVTRPEILARLDGKAIAAVIADVGTDWGIALIGINLLAELTPDAIPLADLVVFAKENADVDADFDDALFGLLERHKLYDTMRQLFDASDDAGNDTDLATRCHEAIAALESEGVRNG